MLVLGSLIRLIENERFIFFKLTGEVPHVKNVREYNDYLDRHIRRLWCSTELQDLRLAETLESLKLNEENPLDL